MKRVYKEDTPEGTISKIRNLLAELPLIPFEACWFNPYKEIYSLRVECLEEDGSFGTNGKGRTRLYALASAYAEFIERLQNGLVTGVNSISRFFFHHIKKENGFYYYPDEVFLSKDEFLSLPEEYLKDIFNNLSEEERDIQTNLYFDKLQKNGSEGVISVPFYDCRNKRIVHLPYNLTIMMSGSNGMAAGNTNSEGIFQGLCELIERNAGSTIYYNLLTPPDVPEAFLSQYPKEYEIINTIRSEGYKVNIKDFSCGKSFPALGVIISDMENNKYRLNVGCDTSFQVALSRVLTEIYQGLRDKEALHKMMLDIPQTEHEYFLSDTEDDILQRSAQLRRFIINGTGVFPRALFEEKASYPFDPEVFTIRSTYKEEVCHLINTFINSGNDVYIRDVSFLGFPSFFIYIPHVSLFGRKTYTDSSNSVSLKDNVIQDKMEDIIFPFRTFIDDKSKITQFLNLLPDVQNEFMVNMKMKELLRLEFEEGHYWEDLPLSYFVCLFYFMLEDYDQAIRYLKLFLKETENEGDEYYETIRRYFELLNQEADDQVIHSMIPSEILTTFSSRELMFSEIDIPNCPLCEDCSLNKNCLTKRKVDLANRIAAQMAKNPFIDQSYIEEYCLSVH